MAIVKAEVTSKVAEIEAWFTGVLNFGDFCGMVEKYFNRSGTEFSRAYYRLLRYSFAEAILQSLTAERPFELPAMPSERPRGYYDIREALSDDGGEAICNEILSITRAEYRSGLESEGGTTLTYKSRHCERWTEGLRAALTRSTSDLNELGDYFEGRYNEYYEALSGERCGRTWLARNVLIGEICGGVYDERHHAEFVSDYELEDDEPVEIREMLNGDD